MVTWRTNPDSRRRESGYARLGRSWVMKNAQPHQVFDFNSILCRFQSEDDLQICTCQNEMHVFVYMLYSSGITVVTILGVISHEELKSRIAGQMSSCNF